MTDIQYGIVLTGKDQSLSSTIKSAREETKGFGDATKQAAAEQKNIAAQLDKTALSAKQTVFALRQVPAQFTDIVVSLQAGQSPMQVLLQQGGQLKDLFGGAVPAVRAMGGYIAGFINPISLSVAGASALGVALYQGASQSQILKDALIITGGIAGKTSGQLNSLAETAGELSGHYGAARDAVVALAQSGKFSGEQIDSALKGVLATSIATGQSIEDLIPKFLAVADDPTKAVKALNETYNFLTADIYKQISALQDQGKTQDAATLALETFAKTMEDRKGQILQNIGYIEYAWNDVKSAITRAWDALHNWGRDTTEEDRVARIKQLQGTLATFSQHNDWTVTQRQNAEKLRAELTKLQGEQSKLDSAARQKSAGAALEKDKISAADDYKKYLGANNRYTPAGLLAKQIEEENEAFAKATRGLEKTSTEYQRALLAHQTAVANIQKKPSKKPSVDSGKTEAYIAAEDNAKLIKTFQEAVAPAQTLSEKLQAQLNSYTALDPALRQYLQGLQEQAKATEQAAAAQEFALEFKELLRESDARAVELEEQANAAELARVESLQKEAQALLEVLDPQTKLNEQQDRYFQMLSEGLIDQEQYDAALKKLGETSQKASSMAKDVGLTFTSAFEDAVTGAKGLREILSSVLKDLAKLVLRKKVTEPLFDAIGSAIDGGGIGDFFSGIFGTQHSGGIVGLETTGMKSAPFSAFNSAPRFHSGGIVGNEVPIIAQRGEGVFTKAQMRQLAPTSSSNQYSVSITVNADGSNRVENGNAGDIGRRIEAAVRAVLIQEKRPNGLLAS